MEMTRAQAIGTASKVESGVERVNAYRQRENDDDATIVQVRETSEGLRALVPGSGNDPIRPGEKRFRIRLASNDGQRSSASYLIRKMYGWRGYTTTASASDSACVSGSEPTPAAVREAITLVASDGERALATISVGFDNGNGLIVEQLYPEEIRLLRDENAVLCEFTKLAVDGAERSRDVLAMIFHIAYMYARRINRCTDLVIEVNPRHVRFYERMLGFVPLGPERLCPRVHAPAVLMRLGLAHAQEQIARFGGRRKETSTRTLYPLFFSTDEENGIVGRLLTLG